MGFVEQGHQKQGNRLGHAVSMIQQNSERTGQVECKCHIAGCNRQNLPAARPHLVSGDTDNINAQLWIISNISTSQNMHLLCSQAPLTPLQMLSALLIHVHCSQKELLFTLYILFIHLKKKTLKCCFAGRAMLYKHISMWQKTSSSFCHWLEPLSQIKKNHIQ